GLPAGAESLVAGSGKVPDSQVPSNYFAERLPAATPRMKNQSWSCYRTPARGGVSSDEENKEDKPGLISHRNRPRQAAIYGLPRLTGCWPASFEFKRRGRQWRGKRVNARRKYSPTAYRRLFFV